MQQNSCKRCGVCCENGGPSLHKEDVSLVLAGRLPLTSLVTIRKNELVHNPKSGRLQPCSEELIKIKGKPKSWACLYFSKEEGCTIYDQRPLACRTLECWNPAALLAIVEEDTLKRTDIIEGDDPLLPLMEEHDRQCPCCHLEELQQGAGGKVSDSLKEKILALIRLDISFRVEIIQRFDLDVQKELLYLGRPYFQLVQPLLATGGGRIFESGGTLHIDWGRM